MPIAPSLLRELSPSRYAEVAKPADAWRSSDGKLVALSSEVELLYWPGRAVYDGHRLRHRLSLYDARLEGRLAVFDAARFPINDVAFHPSRPLIAVGTGSYDGGWFFEGDLWLWNWETGETQTLLDESRDVARCRWTEEGSLAVLLRPRDEGEFSDGGDEAFQTFVGVVLEGLRDSRKTGTGTAAAGDPRLRDLKPTDPATLGFSARPVAYGEGRRRFNDIMAAAEFESRARVWDLLWLTDAHLAAVHDQCHAEVWDVQSPARVRSHTGEGFGVQLVRTSAGALVNVLRPTNLIQQVHDRSTLYRLTVDSLSHLQTFEHAVVLSTDAFGNVLCRDPGDIGRERERADRILNSAGQVIYRSDIGHYDCFNHYLRLDGGDSLFFLRGTPPSSYQNKQLCRISPDGAIASVTRWDNQGEHLMNSVACWTSGTSLVRSYRIYNPAPGAGVRWIERVELTSVDRPVWKLAIEQPATALVVANGIVLYALTSGVLAALDVNSGKKQWEMKLEVDGVSTIATALAVRAAGLAVGTADGRVLLYGLKR